MIAHGDTEDQRAENCADDARQIEQRAVGVRQPIANQSPNQPAEGARQERGPLGRARPALQHASTRDHRDYNADQGPHEIRHWTLVFGTRDGYGNGK